VTVRKRIPYAPQAATFIKESDAGYDLYEATIAMPGGSKTPILICIPTLVEGAAPRMLEAVGRRREANLTGRCPCGATTKVILERGKAIGLDPFAHEDDCPADNDTIDRLIAETQGPYIQRLRGRSHE